MQQGPQKTAAQEWWYNTVVPWWYDTAVPWWNTLDWHDQSTWINAGEILLSVLLWLMLFYLIFRTRKQFHANQQLKQRATATALKQAALTQRHYADTLEKIRKPETEVYVLGKLVEGVSKASQENNATVERAHVAAMGAVENAHAVAMKQVEDANKAVARAYDSAMDKLEEVQTTAAAKMQEQCSQTIGAILKSQKRALEVVRAAMKVLEGATPDKVYEMTAELKDLGESHDKVLDKLEDLQKAVARPSPKDVDDEDDED